MSIQPSFRSSLARSIQVANTKSMRDSFVANCILNRLDRVMVEAWSHVSDMGMSKTEFAKIKRLVKKRL